MCGQIIRFEHTQTGKNLHSHEIASPLSRKNEVSGYGDDGEGDEGDNWIVTCNDAYWERDGKIKFKHVATGSYLHVTGDTFGRPIHGQSEICAYPNPNDFNYWTTAEGVYIKPTDDTRESRDSDDGHDEL